MKKLEKLDLKQVALEDNEMKTLVGGKIMYYCTRMQRNYDGSITVYPFSTDNVRVANSWCAFWESAGWYVTQDAQDDGSGNSATPYYYA